VLPSDAKGVRQGKRKRHRNRKRDSSWKPYSQLTWEEKKELEERESKRQEVEVPEIPRTKDGRIRRGVRLADYRPLAPRNTTAEIIGLTDPAELAAAAAVAPAAAGPSAVLGASGTAPVAAAGAASSATVGGLALPPAAASMAAAAAAAAPVAGAATGMGTAASPGTSQPDFEQLLVSGTGSMAGRVPLELRSREDLDTRVRSLLVEKCTQTSPPPGPEPQPGAAQDTPPARPRRRDSAAQT
jgi:hypothetical protein